MFIETIVRDDQRLYRINDDAPWTGKVVDIHPNGQKKFELRYRKGLREGLSNWWSDEGWIRHERTYSGGELHGSWIQWYKLGQPRQEQVYQQNKEIFRRGWWPNGQLNFEVEFDDGIERHRKVWSENGQLSVESGEPTGGLQDRPNIPKQKPSPPDHPSLGIPKPAISSGSATKD